jgi:hypothetical protein
MTTSSVWMLEFAPRDDDADSDDDVLVVPISIIAGKKVKGEGGKKGGVVKGKDKVKKEGGVVKGKDQVKKEGKGKGKDQVKKEGKGKGKNQVKKEGKGKGKGKAGMAAAPDTGGYGSAAPAAPSDEESYSESSSSLSWSDMRGSSCFSD